jgi:two-component system chemotaxis response regulator CheB
VVVLEKPRGDELDESWERRVIDTVKLVARIKVITHPRLRLGALGRAQAASPPPAPREASNGGPGRLVAIGASTGGPGAVLEILRGLPADYPLPVLIVVHIGEPFGTAFADWLDAQSPIGARYARDGEPLPRPGEPKVLLAPPDRHLVLRDGRLRLTADSARHSCRPSVDVLFESLAREIGAQVIACLLTGMGKDGAHGLLAIRRAGGVTLAQDEATSVVFGMPREAIEIGAACSVLPLNHIAPTLVALAAAVRQPGGAREAVRTHRR